MKRILSFLLAVVMVTTFALPSFAFTFDPVTDVIDMINGGETVTGGDPPPPAQPAPPPDSGITNKPPTGTDNTEKETATPALGESGPEAADDGYFRLDCTPEQAARLIAFFEFAKGHIANQPMFMPFAAPGDTATATWSWGEPVGVDVGGYYINNILSININTANPPAGRAFCFEFGPDPGGSYTASRGSNNQVLRLLIAYHNGSASAVGVQLALWAISNGLPFVSHPQAAAAVSAAGSVNTSGYTYYLWNSGSGQPIVTLDTASTPGPDPDPDGEGYRIEVETRTETRTEVRSSTSYEYSDAIGQLLVAKRDNEGRSLDGAVFDIHVQFSDGSTGGVKGWEVYNGSRLYTYTHPRDNNRPATVTVTEVRAPDGYIADPTSKSATIHPTYTRVTKVML